MGARVRGSETADVGEARVEVELMGGQSTEQPKSATAPTRPRSWRVSGDRQQGLNAHGVGGRFLVGDSWRKRVVTRVEAVQEVRKLAGRRHDAELCTHPARPAMMFLAVKAVSGRRFDQPVRIEMCRASHSLVFPAHRRSCCPCKPKFRLGMTSADRPGRARMPLEHSRQQGTAWA